MGDNAKASERTAYVDHMIDDTVEEIYEESLEDKRRLAFRKLSDKF